jgi:hypothetical protein
MRKSLIVVLIVAAAALQQPVTTAQQVPFLSELFSRYEEFNRAYAEKQRAGESVSAIEVFRKRAEQAFKNGNIPGIRASSKSLARLKRSSMVKNGTSAKNSWRRLRLKRTGW